MNTKQELVKLDLAKAHIDALTLTWSFIPQVKPTNIDSFDEFCFELAKATNTVPFASFESGRTVKGKRHHCCISFHSDHDPNSECYFVAGISKAENSDFILQVESHANQFYLQICKFMSLYLIDNPDSYTKNVKVTRIDYAFDFIGEYDFYHDYLLAFCKSNSFAYGTAGSVNKRGEFSRTLYSHQRSAKPIAFFRFYEKSKQALLDVSNLQRLEFEIHPGQIHRDYGFECFRYLVSQQHEKIISTSKWVVTLLNDFAVDLQHEPKKYDTPTTPERSLAFALTQYSKTVEKLVKTHSIDLNDLFSQVLSKKDYSQDEKKEFALDLIQSLRL